jgi:hypothetical protein
MNSPRFGDRVVNTAASDRNPTKQGVFVRRVVKSGTVNPGAWWELTDGQGHFWRVSPESCEIEPGRATAATLERRALALAGELHSVIGPLGTTATETATREIGGLEMLATLLNKHDSLTEAGLRFAAAMIEETRDWLAEIARPEGAA